MSETPRPAETEPGPGDRVEELLAGCLAHPPEERERALQEAATDHPELADALRRRAQALAGLGMLALDGGGKVPDRLGEFELLERLGGGGMGVVYRARQEPLGREVALKIIRPEHLYFPRARERFRRETEAVARLQHPGIVPIYTVGEDGGTPYFAMELVPGCTLAEALAALAGRSPESLHGADLGASIASVSGQAVDTNDDSPWSGSWTDTCLALTRQLALALAHAHERGIVHRDVKPSNIALTPDGRTLLLDFGLTSSLDADPVTRSGTLVGTPAYMSPEQVRGSRDADHRTDVYSLGVTLYEMLTLAVPFQGQDLVETQALILDGRPDPVRARNRSVSLDAQTVCLAAMDVEPARRYASAEALAGDLGAVLARRPISARPPGATVVVRRWIQRHPGAALALLLAVALVAGIPTALLLQARTYAETLGRQYTSEQQARELAEQRRIEADEQRALADEQRAHADEQRDLADGLQVLAEREATLANETSEFLGELFALADPDRSGGQPLTVRDVLDRGVARIRTEFVDQPALRAALMRVMGRAYHSLGDYAAARTLLEDSLAAARETDDPDPTPLIAGLMELTQILVTLGESRAARTLVDEELALLQGLGPEWDGHRLVTNMRRARIDALEQRWEQAESTLRELIPELERLDDAEDDLSVALITLGSVLNNRAQHGEVAAEAAFEEARDLLQRGIALREATGRRSLTLANGRNNLALTLKFQGQLDEAEACYRAAIDDFRRLLPADDDRVAGCLVNLAALAEGRGELAEAIDLTRVALDILTVELPADHPDLALVAGNLAGTLFRAGRYDEAEEAYGSVLPLQRAAFGEPHVYIGWSLVRLGLCQLRREAHESGEDNLRAAVEMFVVLDRSGDAASVLDTLAQHYAATGRDELAADARDRARALRD